MRSRPCSPVPRSTLGRLLAWACAALSAAAAAQPACLPQRDIAAGNRAALALFRERVVDASAVGAAAATQPAGFADAAAHGAAGDGITDDTAALQQALEAARKVWLGPGRVYRIQRRLTLPDQAELASDGSATLLLAAGPGGFDNAAARRTEEALYGERGVALRIEGSEVSVRDLFIVKEFEDERYVIGIDVRAASRVRLERLRLRGFSLAPGIITIRSSDDVRVSATLIHAACTASRQVPPDLAAFQVSGISVDDSRIRRRASTGVLLRNNVIADLRMIPLTYRKTQTDGIDFGTTGAGLGARIEDNDISGVDEALDISASGVAVTGNRLQASGTVVKLIHGARAVTLRGNRISAAGDALAIGLFRANPAEEARQVRDILVEGNDFQVATSRQPALRVDAEGAFAPTRVTIRDNRFDVAHCRQQTLACLAQQCALASNRRRAPGGDSCPD